MSTIFKIFFSIIFIVVSTGCVKKEIKIRNIETPIEPIKKIKKPIKKTKEPIKKVKKIVHTYKYCNKHRDDMLFSKNYILNEFEKAYFSKKDVLGAKAQLFLVESNSPSVFAKNINAAIKVYDKNYNKAKKNSCNLKKFKTHPLLIIKSKIKTIKGKL